MYMLDTNIVSDMIRNPNGVIAHWIARVGQDNVAASIIVASELRYGVERRRSDRLARQMELILDTLPVLPLEGDIDAHYARLRVSLERRGLPISGNDMFIAAHALALGATLVTDNVREFGRVEGLAVENWLRDD